MRRTASRMSGWSSPIGSATSSLSGRVATSFMVCSSLPLEHRLALLVERADAFLAVLGRDQPIIRLDFEQQRVFQVHLHAVMDRFLGLPYRQRRVGRNGF